MTLMESVSISEVKGNSQPLIDDVTHGIIANIIYIGLGSFIYIFGMCTNVFNIVVYLKMGVKDSVTVQFLALSVIDWVICVLGWATSACSIVGQLVLTTVDTYTLAYCIGDVKEKAYAMSEAIICLMSFERSFCVAFPFEVKLIFTKSRSVNVIACITVVFLALLVPEYLTRGLAWTYDPRVNSTRLLLWASPDRPVLEVFKLSVLAGLMPVLTGVTATICLLYISSAVTSSNAFRRSGATNKHLNKSLDTPVFTNGEKHFTSKTRMSGSDLKAARTVVVVDAMFIACNLPKYVVLASSIVALYIPEFRTAVPGKYQNLVYLFHTITYTFETIHSACSFLIYYAFSTKFKRNFKTLLSRH